MFHEISWKYFMFHEMSWKKYFTVYPGLNVVKNLDVLDC